MTNTEAAHALGLVPLAWLVGFRLTSERASRVLWWLAAAFGVSWVADSHWPKMVVPIVQAVYPVGQAAIVGVALLDRKDATLLATVLFVVGSVSVLWTGVLLDTVAGFAIVGLALTRREIGRVRWALVALGLSFPVWWGYLIWPSTEAWSVYQSTRLLATVLFCWACTQTRPRLTLMRDRGTGLEALLR